MHTRGYRRPFVLVHHGARDVAHLPTTQISARNSTAMAMHESATLRYPFIATSTNGYGYQPTIAPRTKV